MDEGNLYMYGISRVDRITKRGGKQHAWFVRLHFVNRKPAISKWFSDNGGGMSQSLAAALEFRDANVKRELIKTIPGQPQLENVKAEQHRAPKVISDKWKKERLERRIKIVEEKGRGKIYVGTGLTAAREARKMGASKVTCWKIKSGRQDYYTVGNFMPGYDLVWDGGKGLSNLEIQKKIGKKKIILGTGREAAIKAQELGASRAVCARIFRGKQGFFDCLGHSSFFGVRGFKTDLEAQRRNGKRKIMLGTGEEAAKKAKELGFSYGVCLDILKGRKNSLNCCYMLPHFEANGFKRELTQEVIDKIQHTVDRYVHHNPLDVAAEVMLNYVGRYEVIDEDVLIKNLVFKYDKILRLSSYRKREVPLYANYQNSSDEYDITDRIVYNQWLKEERFESI